MWAAVTIPKMSIRDEEVAVSVDQADNSSPVRLMLQSLNRPDLGITILHLSNDGLSLEGGDETWASGAGDVVIRAKRKRQAAPASAEPAPAAAPAAALAAAPAAAPAAAHDLSSPIQGSLDDNQARGGRSPRVSFVASFPDQPPSPTDRSPEREWTVAPGGVAGGVGRSAMNLDRLRPMLPDGGGGQMAEFSERPDLVTGSMVQETQAIQASQEEREDRTRRLVAAAARGETEDVLQLLAYASVSGIESARGGPWDGQTPLAAAVSRGQLETLDALLARAGGQLDAPDRTGDSPVVHAVRSERVEALQRLLDAGASAAGPADADGRTPLMLAAAGARPELCRSLLAAGSPAMALAVDAAGRTALHHAARGGRGGAVVLLLEARVAIDARDNEGFTPLMAAAAAGRAQVVKMLLARRADPGKCDDDDRNAMDLAKANAQDAVVRTLAEAGGA